MSEKIRNLELKLIKEQEFTATSGKSPFTILGNLTVRNYNSNLGYLEIHELSNKKGQTKEYILTNHTDLEKRKRIQKDFYGEKIKLAVMFKKEDLHKLYEGVK